MPHRSHPPRITRTLPGGEILTLGGRTIPDPETGRPVPAATLHLPAWRLRELARALHLWSHIQTMIITQAHLPTETDLADHLAGAASALTTHRD
jgi:hypothetical protein